MAFTARVIDASAADVFEVLIDPYTYPQWLIGAQEIRDVDDDWPAVGSAFHHRVGTDESHVLAVAPGERLQLRSGPGRS